MQLPSSFHLADIDPAVLRTTRRDQFLSALKERALVMGILNVTPDSFSDGGQHNHAGTALAHAQKMVREGADILDIGAESTRPGHTALSAAEELIRLQPVLRELAMDVDAPISIDTYKAETAKFACLNGIGIINDVWAFQRDEDMPYVVSDMDCAVIIMHNRDNVDSSIDIIDDIARVIDNALEQCIKAAVPQHHIIIDPGIGFGKTPEQNYHIIRNIQLLKTFGFPVLIGLSRKRMVGAITGKDVENRLAGTVAANMIALMNGADIIRVHDVDEHVDALKTLNILAD